MNDAQIESLKNRKYPRRIVMYRENRSKVMEANSIDDVIKKVDEGWSLGRPDNYEAPPEVPEDAVDLSDEEQEEHDAETTSEIKDDLVCDYPDCDFVGKSAAGLNMHKVAKHGFGKRR